MYFLFYSILFLLRVQTTLLVPFTRVLTCSSFIIVYITFGVFGLTTVGVWTTVFCFFGQLSKDLTTMTRKRNLSPSPLVTHWTYGWQNSHQLQLPNNVFHLFNLYEHGSVCSDFTGSIPPFHLLFTSLQTKSLFHFEKKKSHSVTGDRDSISRTSLFETFLMMCRSTSLDWIEFFPNYWITMTVGLSKRVVLSIVEW